MVMLTFCHPGQEQFVCSSSIYSSKFQHVLLCNRTMNSNHTFLFSDMAVDRVDEMAFLEGECSAKHELT